MRKILMLTLLLFVGAAQAATPYSSSPGSSPGEDAVATPVATAAAEEPVDNDDAIEAFDESAPDPFADPADATDNSAEQAAVRAAMGKGHVVDPAPADPLLRPVFDEFGGEPGLVALMDELMTRLVADPRTHSFFAQVDQAEVKKHLVEQFCKILGGGCEYTGRDMRTAHAGLGIERAHLNALVEDLQKAMDARGIPFRAQNKLLAKLAPMHRQIEEK